MSPTPQIRATALLAVLLSSGCPKPLPPTMVPTTTTAVRTSDGWVNHLRHYAGEGEPVLLVHGMGANHYNFDYRHEVSLAHALQERGWDVWITDLRGDWLTVPPSPEVRWEITFDDYARYDIPAAVDAVLSATGAQQVHWVGHSMGGMLLYAWLAQRPETIASGVTICSPSTFEAYEEPWTVRTFRFATQGRGRIPARSLAQLTRPLGRSNPMYGRIANRDNLDWGITKGMARHALSDLPKPVARQALTWLESGALIDTEGRDWVQPADVPLLVLGAQGDRVVAEADVRATCERFPDCTYQLLSRSEGMANDPGHIDPVVGTIVDEVYPAVLSFLEAQRTAP